MNPEMWRKALEPLKRASLEDRLFTVTRKIDKVSHIEVDQEKFQADPDPAILFICPAKVYERHPQTGECIIHFENCLECGTCQVADRYVRWDNPNGGFGVTYRYG